MVDVIVIGDETRTVDANLSDRRVLVDPPRLPDALGWELKPEGLCRDDVCVPVRDPADLFVGDALDLELVGSALDRAVVVDGDARLVAVALDGETRRRALERARRARVHAARPRRQPARARGVAGPQEAARRVRLLVRLPL